MQSKFRCNSNDLGIGDDCASATAFRIGSKLLYQNLFNFNHSLIAQ